MRRTHFGLTSMLSSPFQVNFMAMKKKGSGVFLYRPATYGPPLRVLGYIPSALDYIINCTSCSRLSCAGQM